MASCIRFGLPGLLLVSLLWASQGPGVESANVLVSAVFGDGSHFYSMVEIGKSLARRGHNVTILISDEYPKHSTEAKYTDFLNFDMFHHPGLKPQMDVILNSLSETIFGSRNMMVMYKVMALLSEVNGGACKSVFTDKALLDRLEKYDVFVTDIAWMCSVYVSSYLQRHRGADIKVAVVAPMTPIEYAFEEAGSPFMLSYQPAALSQLTSSMTFVERIRNVASYIISKAALGKRFMIGPYADLVDEYDLDPQLKTTISNQVELYLMNYASSSEFPFAAMPNVIPVGSLTATPAEPLSEDLEKFMQSSGDAGVVVFSLGTYFSMITKTRPDIVSMFLDAFSRLPQKVLMHLRELPDRSIPGNVKALPWLPLNDLLGHPKTRAVLYHGGNNGYQEVVYHGVPIVVMPLGGDQFDVAARVVAKCLGTFIDKERIGADYIYQQLTEVLENPTYASTAKRLSAIYRDQPMTGPDTGAFWIEHVLKHGGDHLRPPTLDMSLFQIYLIDVIGFFVAVTGLAVYLVTCVVRRCCCGKRSLMKTKKE